jgi:predicted alpha/beta-hydrolase family hydrolase
METRSVTIPISDSIGAVSGLLVQPTAMKAILTLAHGAGAGMLHPFMASLAGHLATHDIGSLRFNFPFTENGKGRPDPPAVAEKTIAVVLQKVAELHPGLPVFAAGKSFGGRMSSQYLSKNSPSFIKGVVFYGFPLHPPGKQDVARAAHLGSVKVPMLFLQGTHDTLAEISLVKKVCSALPLATLVEVEGADHSFKAGKKEILPVLAEETDKWMTMLL